MKIEELSAEDLNAVSGGSNPTGRRVDPSHARSVLGINLGNANANNTRATQTTTNPSDYCLERVRDGRINSVHDC